MDKDGRGLEGGKEVGSVLNGSFTGLPATKNPERNVLKIGCISMDKGTIPLKLVLFLYYGGYRGPDQWKQLCDLNLFLLFVAMAAIMPYLTIHMLSIGISIQETAIIYGILPFTSFIGPPLIGVLADKLGQYKTVLIVVTIANAVCHSLLLAVPTYREIPIKTTVQLQWNSDGFYLTPDSEQHCPAFVNHFSSLDTTDLTTTISACYDKPEYILRMKALNESLTSNSSAIPEFCQPAYATQAVELLDNICSQFDPTMADDMDNDNKTSLGRIATLRLQKPKICSVPILSPQINATSTVETFGCQTNITIDTGERLVLGSNALTFWFYFIVRILATTFMSACYTMMDAAVLAVGKKNPKARFGVQRIFSVLGQATMSLLAGILVDRFSRGKPYKDYSAAFHTGNVLFLLNVLAYFVVKIEVEQPGKNVLGNTTKLCKYPEVVTFLAMIFLLGNMWGFVKSYLFVLLKDELQADTTLLGLTVTVASVVAIPILYWADKIVDKVGRVNVIASSFVVYFIRFVAYSYLQNAWWSLPFEAMEALTYHLMWTAAATYCGVLAPKGLLATMSGIMGTLHYRLGQGSGSFIGGYVIGAVDMRPSFLYFGIASLIFGIIYIIVNYAWIEKVVKRRNAKRAAKAEADAAENGNEKIHGKTKDIDNDDGAGEVMLPVTKTQT